MEVYFKDKKMERAVKNERLLLRTYGAVRGRLLMRRLDDIRFAGSFADLKLLPGHYHELTGNRHGQWACDLDQPYRLILEPVGERGDWKDIKIVDIIEIVNYHGK